MGPVRPDLSPARIQSRLTSHRLRLAPANQRRHNPSSWRRRQEAQGESIAYYHATGAVGDPSKIGPYLDEEKKILADLQAEDVGSHTALIANPVTVASLIRQALK